ncbi:hypothetical protein EO238_25935, partial [Citrobacter sp. AAK_AS5]
VPCVPGSDGELPDDPVQIRRIARTIGYPVIIKAAGGGGGRGLQIGRALRIELVPGLAGERPARLGRLIFGAALLAHGLRLRAADKGQADRR